MNPFSHVRRGLRILSNHGTQALCQATVNSLTRILRGKYKYHKYKLEYGSSYQTPSKLLWVSPSCVRYKSTPFFWKEVNTDITHIRGGRWDMNRFKEIPEKQDKQDRFIFLIENWSYYTSMYDYFNKNKSWSETDLYQKKRQQMNQEDLFEYFQQIEEIYVSMKTEGYKTQRELADSASKSKKHWHHEIAINIGRDGTLILDDGRHRFCLSKIIGIEEIPVRVLVRHEKWQEILAEVHQAGSVSELTKKARSHLDHPDIVRIAEQKGFI